MRGRQRTAGLREEASRSPPGLGSGTSGCPPPQPRAAGGVGRERQALAVCCRCNPQLGEGGTSCSNIFNYYFHFYFFYFLFLFLIFMSYIYFYFFFFFPSMSHRGFVKSFFATILWMPTWFSCRMHDFSMPKCTCTHRDISHTHTHTERWYLNEIYSTVQISWNQIQVLLVWIRSSQIQKALPINQGQSGNSLKS